MDKEEQIENLKNESDIKLESRKRDRNDSGSGSSSEVPTTKRSSGHVSNVWFEFLSQVEFLTYLISQNINVVSTKLILNYPKIILKICNDLTVSPPTMNDNLDKQKLQLSKLSAVIKDPVYPK